MFECFGKKVEYIELIYDLIFVVLIGKSNSLLDISGGFFSAATFARYIFFSLVILQIWYFSTLFINRYGSNGVGDHIFLFVSMYLLYYLADGISLLNFGHYIRFNAAWGLLLTNLAVQYGIRLAKSATPWEKQHLRYHMFLLLIEAAIVFGSVLLYRSTHLTLSWICLLFGFAAGFFTERVDSVMPVNFEHLSERVMLFVVFTFGEMIAGISGYFDGNMSFSAVYFSLTAFLIAAGFLVSYGFLYDRIIDRERPFSGTVYMLIHIVLITALNCVTLALGYMPLDSVAQIPKNIFLVTAFLVYYIFLFFLGHYAKANTKPGWRLLAALIAASLVFTGLEAVFYDNGFLSVAVSVLYVYAVFGMIVLRYRKEKKKLQNM